VTAYVPQQSQDARNGQDGQMDKEDCKKGSRLLCLIVFIYIVMSFYLDIFTIILKYK